MFFKTVTKSSNHAAEQPSKVIQHSIVEDVLAILTGTFLMSIAIVFFSAGEVLTGGVAGAALILHYISDLPFGVLFLSLSVPFYLLSILQMGWQFTLKTAISIALVSCLPFVISQAIEFSKLNALLAALIAGICAGQGLIILLRHNAGIGGVTILAQYLQSKGVCRAGYFQLFVDCSIVLASVFVLPATNIVYSVIGAIVMNIIIAFNYRPGRYFA